MMTLWATKLKFCLPVLKNLPVPFSFSVGTGVGGQLDGENLLSKKIHCKLEVTAFLLTAFYLLEN